MITQQQSFSELHHLARIARLLARPENQRGPEWLELALQSAVSVEFSTIPPYLSALWSIKDQMHPVASLFRHILPTFPSSKDSMVDLIPTASK